jgi:alpha-galactosidase
VARHLLQSPSYELSWLPERGTFRLQSPGRLFEGGPGIEFVRHKRVQTISTADLTAGRAQEAFLNDAQGEAQELRLHYQELHGLALSLRLRLYASRPFALARLSVTNVGPEPVHLRRFFIESIPEGIETTSPPTGCYTNGWQSSSGSGFHPVGSRQERSSWPERWLQGPMIHNGATPRARHPDRFWSELCGALVTQREALIGGIVSTANQFGQMQIDLRATHPYVSLQTQMDDVALSVGESRHSEWLYLEWVPLPNLDPFAQYAHAVARQMAVGTLTTPVTGWCSWPTYGRQVSEPHMMENLASAALLADEIPLRVLQLDNGYQEAWGDWRAREDRFSHGLDWLADRIRGSGFRPGIWLAPLIAARSARVAREHPDWLLRKANGRPVKAGLVGNRLGHALDPTHPDVLAHINDIIETVVRDWGYDYLKLDFLYAGALMGKRWDKRVTRAQALRHMFEVIRSAAGPDVFLVGSGAPFGPAIGIFDAMRIGPDTAPTWKPDLGILTRLVSQNPSLPSLRNSLKAGMTRAWMHGRWWVNDPDVVLLRANQTSLTDAASTEASPRRTSSARISPARISLAEASLTENEVLANVTLAGLNGGSVVLSDDLDDLSPAWRQMVSVLFSPLLDGLDVPDLFETPMPEIAIVPVARSWGRWRLVALFNWSTEEVERELPDTVMLDDRKTYHLVDYWAQRYLLLAPGAIRPVVHIPPHGVVLLGLRQVKPGPHIVSSTFHISQGAEISHFEVQTPKRSVAQERVPENGGGASGPASQLSLTVDIGRVAKGSIWLSIPSRPKAVSLDGEPLSDKAVRAIASGVWSVTCRIAGSGTLTLDWHDPGPA